MNNIEEYNDNKFCPELNFTEHWTDLILQEELKRGTVLREQKVKKNTYEEFYGKKNYVCKGPSTSKTDKFCQIYRKQPYCKYKTKKRNTKTCPLRIAELAVPSKRSCIDTWRTKSNVIPNFMVERLRQRVMDEKPIVQISDAISCFKRTKTKTQRGYKLASNSTADSIRMNKIKILCAIFGFKIMYKLQKPLNISLTCSLDRINNVVKEEIITLLQYKSSSRRNIEHKEILDEVSRQITFWIVNILDETDYKLLRENLEELEEQEGPALDFIDDLVDQVLSICVPSRHEIYQKLPEKNQSISLMPLKESDDEIIKVVQSNVKLLITGICLELLKDAEEQIEQNRDKDLLFEGISKLKKGVGKVPSIISDSSENISEYLRLQLETTIKEIPERLIIDEIRHQDQQDESLLNENYEGKRGNENMLKFYSKEFNDYMEDFPELLPKETESEADLRINEQSNVLNSNFNMDSKAHPLELFVSTPQVNDSIGEKFNNIVEKEETLLKESDIDNNESQFDNSEKKEPQDILKTENNMDNVADIIEKEVFAKNNETVQEGDNNFQFMDAENKDLYLFHLSSDTTQIIENVLNRILDLVAKESAYDDDDVIEEMNKKVKFSAIDMGNALTTEIPTKQSSHELVSQKPSSDYLKQIDFASPNENLLSNADESWPHDMPLPTIKVTESVNKSVTSLGKIFEANEKEISSESSYVSIQSSGILINLKLTSISAGNKIKDHSFTPFQNEKEIIKEQNTIDKMAKVKPQSKEVERKRRMDNNKNGYAKREENPKGVTKNNLKTSVNKKNHNKTLSPNNDSNSITINKKTDLPRRHNMYLQNKTKLQYKTNLKPKVVNKEKSKHIYKAKPKEKIITRKKHTVPEKDHIHITKLVPDTFDKVSNEAKGGNYKELEYKACSSEKLSLAHDKTKLKQMASRKKEDYKIEKWCQGLESVIENLELWNAWMNSTCKCITNLKQKEKFKSSRTQEICRKKWKMLHRNIQQDTILWKDIKRRNKHGLKSFQKIYDDIKKCETKLQICDCNNY